MQSIKYWLIQRLLGGIGRLSLRRAQQLGALLGRLLWVSHSSARRITEINLQLAYPELPAAQRRDLALDSLTHTGRTILEIPLMWEWPVQCCLDLVQKVDGLEHLHAAQTAGRGLILLAPHLGNWELAGLYFSSRFNMAALYSPPNIPQFEAYMIRVRSRLGSELVRGDRRGLARLSERLREGGIIGILPDQSPRGQGFAFAPFFGVSARTMTLVNKLARKSGARILATYAERLPNAQGFRIRILPCPDDALRAADSEQAATALNAVVEQCVRTTPAQYQWEYKRFRYPPEGYPDPYRKPSVSS